MVTVRAVTDLGGAVDFNKEHGVWASYAVARAGDAPPSQVFVAGVKLADGRFVQFFVNRQSNLVSVDVVGRDERDGVNAYHYHV